MTTLCQKEPSAILVSHFPLTSSVFSAILIGDRTALFDRVNLLNMHIGQKAPILRGTPPVNPISAVPFQALLKVLGTSAPAPVSPQATTATPRKNEANPPKETKEKKPSAEPNKTAPLLQVPVETVPLKPLLELLSEPESVPERSNQSVNQRQAAPVASPAPPPKPNAAPVAFTAVLKESGRPDEPKSASAKPEERKSAGPKADVPKPEGPKPLLQVPKNVPVPSKSDEAPAQPAEAPPSAAKGNIPSAEVFSIAPGAELIKPTESASKEPAPLIKAESKSEINSPVRTPQARDISLKLSPNDSPGVELRISERGGKVHVAVHSTDGDLRHSLQSNLGELVGRLERKGFETETWTPSHGTDRNIGPAQETAAGGGQAQDSQQGGQRQGGHSQADQEGRKNRPQWLKDVSAKFSLEDREETND